MPASSPPAFASPRSSLSLWRTLLCCALLLCAVPAWARPQPLWTGVVSHVTDGDTLWVRPDGGAEALKIRLRGLDAPEACQSFGPQARDLLAQRALQHSVQVQVYAQDRYGRRVARVTQAGEDLAAYMVRAGGAWAEAGYRGRHGRYQSEQELAQAERRGLWADPTPERPAAFRRRHGACPDARRGLRPGRASLRTRRRPGRG